MWRRERKDGCWVSGVWSDWIWQKFPQNDLCKVLGREMVLLADEGEEVVRLELGVES